VLRDVEAGSRKRGSLVALLVGLTLVAAVHVFACAGHAHEGHHAPIAASATAAVPHAVDRSPELVAHDNGTGGSHDCCCPASHVCDGPLRTRQLSLLLLGLAVLACAMPYEWPGPGGTGRRPSPAPPPRAGAVLLQLACVSRT
jgi:hypothetical protein